MTVAVLGAITDLGWSAVGLVVGYLLGLLSRLAVTELVLTRDRRDLIARLAGLVLVIAVILAGTQVYQAQAALRAQAECEAAYIESFNAALTARLEATEDERSAQRELLLGVLGESRSEPAVREYLRALEELDRARRLHPLPTRPDCDDGDS